MDIFLILQQVQGSCSYICVVYDSLSHALQEGSALFPLSLCVSLDNINLIALSLGIYLSHTNQILCTFKSI